MKIVFDYIYVRNNLPLFIVASILTVLIIATLLIIGVMVIKKNVHK